MAYHLETDMWPSGVYQVAVTDPVLGGTEGPVNLMGLPLAKRSLYQRLRNVTEWSADLAAAFGYPAKACVMHGGVSWRAIVANNVAPGTDITKWERWAYSATELAAYLRSALLSPATCAATGPAAAPSDASPYTIWKSVAPYNEYWMWLGDVWKVVANRYTTFSGVASSALTGGVAKNITTLTAHRDGSIYIRGILSATNNLNAFIAMSAYVQRTRAAVTTTILDSFAEYMTTTGTQYSQARPLARTDALAGDVYTLVGIASSSMIASAGNNSSLHMEYLQ
ncbi:hypothetical protein ACVC7V_17550 [Hydrogenophaga sp. A37]|uniref:hypothetical protein n=1 Tax=Hydrogenophaga sp. A37 TaxID=1945864 RepID=UPI000986826B|nr:hypothetical protein [Hydrogenophaga sp. A37]OOG79162.1 hypothetical protein B0E41_25390 [Hydrogenophaga sp. A37]